MPIGGKEQVGQRVLAILKEFVPSNTSVRPHHLIGRELGVTGWDSIDFLERLEAEFHLDLKPMIEAVAVRLKPRLIDRLMGRKRGPLDADVTAGQLTDYIFEHSTEAE